MSFCTCNDEPVCQIWEGDSRYAIMRDGALVACFVETNDFSGRKHWARVQNVDWHFMAAKLFEAGANGAGVADTIMVSAPTEAG